MMPVFRDHGQPGIGSVFRSEFRDDVMLFVLFAVIADRGARRDHVVLVDDRIADPAVFADIHIVEQDAVVHGGITVDINRIEQDGIGDRAAGNDAAVAHDGVDRLADPGQTVDVNVFVMHEFGRRQTEMVVVDRPLFVVKIQLRCGGAQIHVGLEERLQGPDIAPVGLGIRLLTRDLVQIEIVGEETVGRYQRRDDVLAEIVRTGRIGMVGIQQMQNILRPENVIPHRSQRHGRIIRQRRRMLRLFLESGDAPVGVHFDDAELMRILDRDRDRRHRRNGIVVDVKIHHLADVHTVDMVSAEHRHQIGTEIFDQMGILENGVRSAHIPGLILGLHLRRNRNDEPAAPVDIGNIPPVDDVFHQALGFELRQHENAVDPAVDEITEHKVDDPVFSSERNGRFRPLIGQRRQTTAFTAGKNHSKYGCSHAACLLFFLLFIYKDSTQSARLNPLFKKNPFFSSLPAGSAGEIAPVLPVRPRLRQSASRTSCLTRPTVPFARLNAT